MTERNVFIGLGTNLGDRLLHLHTAVQELSLLGLPVAELSGVYETPPWGIVEQPPFLNAVARLECDCTPEAVLHTLLLAEQRMGRIRDQKWGPRIIDLDVLAIGAIRISTPKLTVPHPHLAERAFVLVPWAEIAPQFLIAGLGLSVQNVLRRLSETDPQSVQQIQHVGAFPIQTPGEVFGAQSGVVR